MSDELISLKTAKLAKRKGLSNRVRGRFVYNLSIKKHISYPDYGESFDIHGQDIWQPSQTFVKRWLREEHHIEVESIFIEDLFRRLHEKSHDKKCLDYRWIIITNTDDPERVYNKFYANNTFKTYEEALEIGLQVALNLLP